MPEFHERQIITNSADETFELAYKLGEGLNQSTIFLLHGDLGAGKTVFAKGIAAGLDIDPANVNSPTFTIVNLHKGRMQFYHLDLYRLVGTGDELHELGLHEMINELNTVIVIEWPERLSNFKIEDACIVDIYSTNNDRRFIHLYK